VAQQIERSIQVNHNIEVAHRLLDLPGKCQQIHGHSMMIHLELWGPVNDDGILMGIDFGDLKKAYRAYLDSNYDHHLLLNAKDPYVDFVLNGTVVVDGDPTVENISKWVGEWAYEWGENAGPNGDHLPINRIKVTVRETGTNGATWSVYDDDHSSR